MEQQVASRLRSAAGRTEAAAQTLYGLVQTTGFDELLTYDLPQDPFATFGYQPSTLTTRRLGAGSSLGTWGIVV